MKTDEVPDDVPLLAAMLTWSRAEQGGGALVVHHPDAAGLSRAFGRSAGACYGDPLPNAAGHDRDWKRMTDAERMRLLLATAWQAVVRDGVTPSALHEALCVVPEFREQMTPDMLPEHYQKQADGD